MIFSIFAFHQYKLVLHAKERVKKKIQLETDLFVLFNKDHNGMVYETFLCETQQSTASMKTMANAIHRNKYTLAYNHLWFHSRKYLPFSCGTVLFFFSFNFMPHTHCPRHTISAIIFNGQSLSDALITIHNFNILQNCRKLIRRYWNAFFSLSLLHNLRIKIAICTIDACIITGILKWMSCD